MTENSLQDQFGIDGALRFETPDGGLARAIISTPEAEAEIYLQGAHIATWTPRGQRPVLFMSSRSAFAPGKAIRGGIPIIYPWFGARSDGKPGPAHGFARTMTWTVEKTALRDGAVEIEFALESVSFRVSVGRQLSMQLEVRNTGCDPLKFEEALHSYFAVSDVREVSVSGLEGTTYVDKTDAFRSKSQPDEPLKIGKETDQVHLNTTATCVISDPLWSRRIAVEKTGSDTTVVWNPWSEKSAAMADMGPDEWRGMICVESANAAENAVTLEPRSSHTLGVTIRVE